jgi:hypothetical protein
LAWLGLALSLPGLLEAIPGMTVCTCGNLATCTCQIASEHKKGCRYRRAAELGIELACEHGLQACPACDPCTCGSTAPLSEVR